MQVRFSLITTALFAALFATGYAPRHPWASVQPPPEKLMRQVADRVLIDFPKPPPFDWGEGVLMAGMMRAGTVLNEPKYIDFVKTWADHWNAQGLEPVLTGKPGDSHPNYCGHWGPAYPVMLLYAKTGDPKYLNMTRQVAEFIMTRATRLKDGGLGHWGDNYQLWVDDTKAPFKES